MVTPTMPALEQGRRSRWLRRPVPRLRRPVPRAGHLFVLGYSALLLTFGVGPALYAVYLSFTNSAGQFVGLGQFIKTASDFRFFTAFGNIAIYMVLWLVALVVLTVGSALLLQQVAPFVSASLRFLFYFPGALAGVAGVLVWLYMLDPIASPVGPLLQSVGLTSFRVVILPENLSVIFAIIAFWTGAGGWIVVMYGALNNVADELLEAARLDGANKWQLATRIQIPLIKKWIAYMVILAFAAGTQLFVEPQLVSAASLGAVSRTWSPNLLAYTYAFTNNDFNGAAAISMYLLLISVVGAALVVFRSGLFDVEESQ